MNKVSSALQFLPTPMTEWTYLLAIAEKHFLLHLMDLLCCWRKQFISDIFLMWKKLNSKSGMYWLYYILYHLLNILNVLFFSLEISLRSYWKDLGIRPAEKYIEGTGDNEKYVTVVPSEWTDKIWMPDIVIMHAINLRTPTYNLEPSSLRYILQFIYCSMILIWYMLQSLQW